MPYFGMPENKSIHTIQPFQDGGNTCLEGADRTLRLDVQN